MGTRPKEIRYVKGRTIARENLEQVEAAKSITTRQDNEALLGYRHNSFVRCLYFKRGPRALVDIQGSHRQR